jgi:hypothetical protein
MTIDAASLSRILPVRNAAPLHALSAVLLALTACSAEIGPPPTPFDELDGTRELGVTRQAVVDGHVQPTNNDGSGIVRLWTTNTLFDEFRHLCSGVLLTNDIVLTARHCFETKPESIQRGWPDLSGDTTFMVVVSTEANGAAVWTQGAAVFAPDGRDLAAVKLMSNLPAFSQGQLLWEGYFHPLGGTPSTGDPLVVTGYGPTGDPTSTVCKYQRASDGARLRGCLGDQLPLSAGLGGAFLNGQEVLTIGVSAAPGDSGGPVFLLSSAPTADMELLGINSLARRCVPLESSNCGATAARLDNMSTWLAVLANQF